MAGTDDLKVSLNLDSHDELPKTMPFAEAFARLIIQQANFDGTLSRDLIQPLSDIRDHLARQMASWSKALEPLRHAGISLHAENRKYSRVEQAGWLPHYTTPFDLVEATDDSGLSQALDDYYGQKWPDVARAFVAELASIDVDEEAKETFVEALEMHSRGFYRGVVRSVFPEVERVVRTEFWGGRPANISSLQEVRQAVGGLGLSELAADEFAAMAYYRRLTEHLYKDVRTAADLEQVKIDPVPNRHAAIHGLAVYRTRQSSLNALIMTEFSFGVISALKAERLLQS